MGAAYLFHDLYGYLMEMSADIAAMIESFDDGVDTAETIEHWRGRLGDADPAQFVDVLVGHQVLVAPDEDEVEGIWAFVPIKGKWNIWQRRDDRLTIWTAWGERPIQQIFLDPDDTAMWDAFDGSKRLIEMRHHFDNDKLVKLVRRLVHHDVQALKLSVMPWSVYAKRPAMAPPYLTSTMPYPSWKPGTPVPPQPKLADYHAAIGDADAQFEHQETTLSHLLRVPHPALRGRTYGRALADVLLERGSVPEGRVRVLEIGAGLGYVARDVILRLRERDRQVDYTIVELSRTLALAQGQRVAAALIPPGGGERSPDGERTITDEAKTASVRFHIEDVLAVDLPEAAFDLVLANEMVGDLPAIELHRTDVGLDPAGPQGPTGRVDLDKVRALAGATALAVTLDDAPDPFYLQTGALALIGKIAHWLAPGGTAIVTEFGDRAAWPKLSTHLDHPELSTHFGHLHQAARAAGLDANIEFVIDLLDFDREQRGLATTRSQFRALRALAHDAGVELDKLGYTPELLAAATGDKLALEHVGDLRWDKIEDRLMGLVPHEFKALVASRAR